jgi:peptide/nickel transport system substrate-binding protein
VKKSFKTKTILFWKRISRSFAFFGKKKRPLFSQAEIDRRLVYNLSPRKIPSASQFKHLPKFLGNKEKLIIRICLLVAAVNVIFLGTTFIRRHLQYLPVVGGEYVEGVVGYPKTINPLYDTNRDVDSDLSSLIYSSLFRYDQNGQLVPDLAENLEIANGKEYTIRIKEGAKWHNGSYVTADDVLFTIAAIQDDNYRSPLRSSLVGVTAEKIDDRTIKLSLGSAYAPFLEVLTFGILPKEIWQDVSPSAASLSELNLKPVGSGPYEFKSLIKNKDGDLKEYNLVANDDYYGAKPYITKVRFSFFPSYQEAISALNDSKIDGLGYLPFEHRSELVAKDSFAWHELIRPQIISLFFNQEKDKALADKVVRSSLARALDKEKLIQDVFGGAYQRADGPIMSSSFAYNSQLKTYPYAPVEAAAEIKGRLASTTITVIDAGNNVAVASQVKLYWEAIGVAVELKMIPGERAADIIKNRDFEVLLYGESVGGDPDVYAFWHSSQIGPKGLNLASYNNQDVDKLLVEARETTDTAVRQAKYQEFQNKIAEDIPAIFLYSPTHTYIQNKKLKGFSGTMAVDPSGRLAGISEWYLKVNKKLAW